MVLQADFDPEEDVKYDSGSRSDDGSSGDEDAGTEHYEKVGYEHIIISLLYFEDMLTVP